MKEISVSSERNPNVDVLKGIAITLVVWGHVIQLMGVQPYTFQNDIWKGIYLFHMPLFFFLSGYVSKGAVARNFKDLFKGRFKSLFIPVCVWSLILYLIKFSLGLAHYETTNFFSYINITVLNIMKEYWYIWVLLYCVFMANIIYRFSRYKTVTLIISVLFVWLLPETKIPFINNLKTMYFFFILGYLVSLDKSKFNFVKEKWVTVVSIPIFILCTMFSTSRTQMYVPQWVLDVWGDKTTISFVLGYYCFYIAGAFSGMCLCYRLMKFIPSSGFIYRKFNDIGKYTFIIYMLQGLWFYSFCERFSINVVYQTVGFLLGLIFTYIFYKIGKYIATTKSTAFLAGK